MNRIAECECTNRFTCRSCLDKAGPTLDLAPDQWIRTSDGKTFRYYALAAQHITDVQYRTGKVLSYEKL